MSEPNPQINHEAAHAEKSNEEVVRNMTVQERWDLMWQMTVDEWAKKGIDITKLPMRRDVARLTRLKDQ